MHGFAKEIVDSKFQSAVAAAIRAGDPRSALHTLNRRTRYRFTGLYRHERGALRIVHLIDRENPALRLVCGPCTLQLDDDPLTPSLGQVAAARPASIGYSARPHRLRLIGSAGFSCCGVAVVGPNGDCAGVLCHLDQRPRIAPEGESGLLDAIAPLFGEFLVVPGTGRSVS